MVSTVNMTVQIGSLKMRNPVTTGSGTFGFGSETKDLVPLDRLGAVTVKPQHVSDGWVTRRSASLKPHRESSMLSGCKTAASMTTSPIRLRICVASIARLSSMSLAKTPMTLRMWLSA